MKNQYPGQKRGITWCKECGVRLQIHGLKWRHDRPQPTGEPWTHKPKPGGPKPVSDSLVWLWNNEGTWSRVGLTTKQEGEGK